MNMFEMRAPFFVPLWRRVAVVVVCFGWALLELISGGAIWAIMFAAIGATATWQFFLSGWPENDDEETVK